MEQFNAHTASPEQKEAWVHATFQNISEDYDLMNDLESFGLHRRWKCKMVKKVVASDPKNVLDIACGTGDIVFELARQLPDAHIVGFDFSAKMLEVARRRLEASTVLGVDAARENCEPQGAADAADVADAPRESCAPQTAAVTHSQNIDFVEGNALHLPFADGSFDAVTVSFGLRNMADYAAALAEMVRVSAPGGCVYCLEASYPTAPVIKQLFKLYFRHIMPFIGMVVTRKKAEYRWLNDSTEAFLSKAQLAELFEASGLEKVKYRSFAFGAAALHGGFKSN